MRSYAWFVLRRSLLYAPFLRERPLSLLRLPNHQVRRAAHIVCPFRRRARLTHPAKIKIQNPKFPASGSSPRSSCSLSLGSISSLICLNKTQRSRRPRLHPDLPERASIGKATLSLAGQG